MYSLLTILTFGVILPFATYVYYQFQYLVRTFSLEEAKHFERLLETSEEAIREGLWNYSTPTIETIVNSLVKHPGIHEIFVYDHNDKLFYKKKSIEQKDRSDVVTTKIHRDIFYNESLIGRIEITYSKTYEDLLIYEQRTIFLVLSISIILAICIITAYMFHVKVILPIKQLLDAANNLTNGNLEKSISRVQDDEIGELATAFEHSRKAILDLVTSLKYQNENLESIVEDKSNALIEASKMSSLGLMAGGIAHEINNPLGVISLRSGVILELIQEHRDKIGDNLSQNIETQAKKIEETVLRITKIIAGLKSYSRDSEKEEFHLFDINEVISECLDIVSFQAKHQEISIHFLTDRKYKAFGKKVEFSQVLVNLLQNAMDAIESLEQKWIKIKIHEEGTQVRITITDSGNGIPLQVRNKIFDPFFTTKEIGKGTGLGLSISANIIKSFQGQLWYDDTAANTTFHIDLKKQITISEAS